MHAFFLPFGVFPNNALVGGSADIAVGSALYKRAHRAPGLSIANIGDASTGCGPVPGYRGGLPVIFFFMNNFYGMGGQTKGETMGFERLAALGAGMNLHNMQAEVIDGNNPLAVIDAIRRKSEIIHAGDGPVLLDVLTYRQSGHSPSDASAYRVREEIDLWREVDPITEFGAQVVESVLPEGALRDGAGDPVHAAPFFEARQGPENDRINLHWPQAVSGKVVLRVRIDDTL